MSFLNHEEIEKAVIKAGELGLEPFMYCNTKVKVGVKRRRRRNRRNISRSNRRNTKQQ